MRHHEGLFRWGVAFFMVAMVAGILSWSGLTVAAAGIAKILFLGFYFSF